MNAMKKPNRLAAVATGDETGSKKKSNRCPLIDSATFAGASYPLEWLVKRVVVAGQPAVIGGPRKALKTSILVDFAISIGARKPFLGHFEVPQAVPVGFVSGESGPHTIQETARNVCKAKRIPLTDAGVWWGFKLPRLSDDRHLARLAEIIGDLGLRVVIFDPLYLCLLSGNSDTQASNLFDMGPLLADIAAACLGAGATPVLCHHSIKRPQNPYAVPELEDLSFAGIQEFARQWLLVGRREVYQLGSGRHALWLSVGGSVGFSHCWALDVDEGQVADDFAGKKWDVKVRLPGEAIEAKARQQEARKGKDVEAKILSTLDRLDPERQGVGFTRLRDTVKGVGYKDFARYAEVLKADGVLEEIQVRGTTKPGRGLRRRSVQNGSDPCENGSGTDLRKIGAGSVLSPPKGGENRNRSSERFPKRHLPSKSSARNGSPPPNLLPFDPDNNAQKL